MAGEGEAMRGGAEEVIDLGIYWRRFRRGWWKAVVFSLAVGVATFLVLKGVPNYYRAVAVLAPSADEDQSPSLSMNALSSMGITLGGATKLEDIEVLLKSTDLAARVFGKNDLWQFAYGDRYDNVSRTLKPSGLSRVLGGGKVVLPGPWDAIGTAKKNLVIVASRKLGTISVSFDSPSPEGSAAIVLRYLEEGRNRLQEEAFERANRNKKFLEEQISKTFDPLTRERFYAIYAREVEKEMLARNREQFGFRIIDAPRVPVFKAGPRRGFGTLAATLLAFLGASLVVVFRGERRGGESGSGVTGRS